MILSEHDRQVLEALEWAESGIAGQLTFDLKEDGGVQKEAPPFHEEAPPPPVIEREIVQTKVGIYQTTIPPRDQVGVFFYTVDAV